MNKTVNQTSATSRADERGTAAESFAGSAAPDQAQEPRFVVSEQPDEPAWDRFLAKAADGHHVQTSIWGRLKATTG